MGYYIAAAIIYLVIMMLTFCDSVRLSAYYIPVSMACNILSCFLWYSLAHSLYDKDAVLINSAYWDMMIMAIGYVLPMFIFGFCLTIMQLIGIAVIFVGFCMLKFLGK